MIDIALFTDAVTIVKEIGNGIVNLSSLPAKRRKHYHEIVDDTFTLLDHAILCVIQRLSDCIRIHREYGSETFLKEIQSLQSVNDWEKIERDVRLCQSLRQSGEQMRHLISNIGDKVSLSDMTKFWNLVNCVLEGETTMANQIAHMLESLSNMSDASVAFDETTQCLAELKALRLNLITSQVEIMQQI